MWRFNLKRRTPSGKRISFYPFFKAILLAGLIFVSAVPESLGQANLSLKGYILSAETLSPVENASLNILETLFKTTTSNNGQFGMSNIPQGSYDIKVSAPGYRDTVITGIEIYPDITTTVDVVMRPRIYPLGKITVRATRQELHPDPVEIIGRRTIEESRAANLPELLESIEGLYIQENGSGGQASVRIRGGQAEHVLILVDGLKINSSGNGRADLNSIPLEMIESVEIYKGGASAEYGPDAMAGAINIITRPGLLSDKFAFDGTRTIGKWNRDEYHLSLRNPFPLERLSTKFSFGRRSSDGDFAYNYSVSGYDTVHSGTRINNDYVAENFFASGIYRLAPAWHVNYSGQSYHSRNGLPGRATRQNEFARTEDKRKLLAAGLKYETNRATVDFNFGFSRLLQNFTDTLTPQPLLQFDDTYENDIITFKHSQVHKLYSSTILKIGAEYHRDKLNHDNHLRPALSMGKSHRDYGGVYLGGERYFDLSRTRVIDQVSFNGILRYDYSRTEKDSTSWADTVKSNATEFFSPKIGIAVSKGDRSSITVRANYGKSFRLPAMNALFWVGDARSAGNPGLKPERSEHSEAGIDFRTSFAIFRISAGALYYHNSISDLIIWGVNSQGVWTPKNLPRARITGHEEHFELSLFEEAVTFRYQNSTTDAISKTGAIDGTPQHNSDGNRIALYPGYITQFSFKVKYRFFRTAYSFRLVDRVFTNLENTRYYDGYRLDDLSFGLSFGVNHTWKFTSDLKINNLRNVDYETMANYPMPGREWRFGIGITLELDKSD